MNSYIIEVTKDDGTKMYFSHMDDFSDRVFTAHASQAQEMPKSYAESYAKYFDNGRAIRFSDAT